MMPSNQNRDRNEEQETPTQTTSPTEKVQAPKATVKKQRDLRMDPQAAAQAQQKEASKSHETLETPESREEEFRSKYLRLLAENENLVKRLRKESRDSVRFATQRVILDLLMPLDQFEIALGHAQRHESGEIQNWAMGFKMISKQFKDWLSAQEVYSFKSVGENFDPTLHEAVETLVTQEQPEGTIVKELLRGYKMGEDILRPARVVVAQSPQKQGADEAKEETISQEQETP